MLAVGLSGCATVAPSVEHTSTTCRRTTAAGAPFKDFPRDPTKLASAAVAEALEDLKMTAIKRSRDGTVYKIEARTEDNRSVLVTVRPHQDQSRVGLPRRLVRRRAALEGHPGANRNPARAPSPGPNPRQTAQLAGTQSLPAPR